MDKQTPLYDAHVKLGGKMTPFAGYLLPIQYETGILKEHNAVREAVGVFDVSHMGEFLVEGENALCAVNYLVSNDLANLTPGRVRYSPMCNEKGGVVDDLLVYMLAPEKLMLVVNAANKEKDFAWIQARLPEGLAFTDKSDETGLIALQGRKALDILQKLLNGAGIPEKNYTFCENQQIAGKRVLVSRTGYTGEDGFEFYTDWDDTPTLFEALMEAGREFGIIPCGLGARDTLRLEASMPLYGHEMNDEITPLEAGLGMFFKPDSHDFVGRQAILVKGAPAVKRVGLELRDRGIAREHCAVWSGGTKIGETTSGTLSPYTGKAIAMAIIDVAFAGAEDIQVEVRGRLLSAKIVPMPFYKKSYR